MLDDDIPRNPALARAIMEHLADSSGQPMVHAVNTYFGTDMSRAVVHALGKLGFPYRFAYAHYEKIKQAIKDMKKERRNYGKL